MMRISYLIAATIVLVASKCFAVGTALDSVYADSIYFGSNPNVIAATNALGKPDNQFAKLSTAAGGTYMYVNFFRHTGATVTTTILPIKAKATLVVWGKKDPEVDTSGATVSLVTESPVYIQSNPVNLLDGMTVIQVPDTEFTYLDFELSGLGANGGKSFLIDAIMLVEDTSQLPDAVHQGIAATSTGLIANYPNPFNNATSVEFSTPSDGAVSLVAVDMQGREHSRADLGVLAGGEHRATFDVHDHGMYFVRLLLNGVPYGNPIKVISE